MMGSFLIKRNKVMEFLFGKMEVNTWEILSMIYGKVMDKCIGLTEQYIKGNGITVLKFKKSYNR